MKRKLKLSVLLLCITLTFGGTLACNLGGAKQPTPVSVATMPLLVAKATPTPSLVTLPDGNQVPLPGDAELMPVGEGFFIGFSTALVEPQLFDFYAAWLSQRGWVMVAPTEAVVGKPYQRWRKGDQELLIELQAPDERGRTVVWLQVSFVAPPSPTALGDIVGVLTTPVPTTAPVAPPAPTAVSTEAPPTAAPPTAPPPLPPTSAGEIIVPTNVNRLAQVGQTTVGQDVRDLAWSSDGRWLALSEEGRLRLYQADTLAPVALPREIEANKLAFSPDGSLLAATRFEGTAAVRIDLWRVADWSLVRTLEGHSRVIMALAFSPDGRFLASGSMEADVRVWDVASGKLAQDLKAMYQGVHPPAVFSVAFSSDGQQVIAGLYGGSVQGWQVSDGTQTIHFKTSTSEVSSLFVWPDGRIWTLSSRSMDAWQPDGSHLGGMESQRLISGGALNRDKQVLATFGQEGVEFWDLAHYQFLSWLDIGFVGQLAFSPDGSSLATLGEGQSLRLWRVKSEESTVPVTDHFTQVWQKLEDAENLLGQAVGPAVTANLVIQHFQHGLMLGGWRDDQGQPWVHVVIYGPADDTTSGQEWYMLEDTWQPGAPEYSCAEAKPPYGPRGSLGAVWCEYDYPRNALGSPLAEERTASGSYQEFQTGRMLWFPGEGVWALSSKGEWRFKPVE